MSIIGKKGFTIMELLIVIAIIVSISTALLLTLNLRHQLDRAQDAKRKSELANFSRVIEDFYNDNNRYPNALEVCTTNNQYDCIVCGTVNSPSTFSRYSPTLPCDPQHPTKDYHYYYDSTGAWYQLYTNLSYTGDPAIAAVGCNLSVSGNLKCPGNTLFNYGVASPNRSL